MTKAIIVARVSSENQMQNGLSIKSQIDRLEDYCAKNNLEIVEEICISKHSNDSTNSIFRRVYDFLISDSGKIAICYCGIDRFIRNVSDIKAFALYEMALQGRIELHFVSNNLIIDRKTPAAGKFQFITDLALANYYADTISENTRKALRKHLEDGHWPNRAPKGYKYHVFSDGKKTITINERQAKLIAWAFETYSNGSKPLKNILAELEQKGLPLSLCQLFRMLHNPFYCGQMKYMGQTYKHKYPKIISKELFDKCQQVRGQGKC